LVAREVRPRWGRGRAPWRSRVFLVVIAGIIADVRAKELQPIRIEEVGVATRLCPSNNGPTTTPENTAVESIRGQIVAVRPPSGEEVRKPLRNSSRLCNPQGSKRGTAIAYGINAAAGVEPEAWSVALRSLPCTP